MLVLKDRVEQPCSMASSHHIAREAERKKVLLEMKSELATMELLRSVQLDLIFTGLAVHLNIAARSTDVRLILSVAKQILQYQNSTAMI